MRIGQGFDVHPFVAGRPLFLGGVEIPHEYGLAGHSDADVVIHALCDALLGAAGMGDIGRHFPDTDPAYRNIYSIRLLEETGKRVGLRFRTIINADITIMAEAPKIAPYAEKMKSAMAGALGIFPDQINIKATTTEGLGFIGRKQGIAAMCVVLIE